MKKVEIILTVIILILLTACEKNESVTQLTGDDKSAFMKSAESAVSYVIVLNDKFEAAADLANAHGYDSRKGTMTSYLNRFLIGKDISSDQIDNVYTNIYLGFSARLSAVQLERLKDEPRIKYIEPDQEIILNQPTGMPLFKQPEQTIPWGISRVGGVGDGTGKTAWVIDTGIDYGHPDLIVDEERSMTFIKGTKTANDDIGHGSMVAGVIAAKDNDIGVVGVAAGATLVAVKVFKVNLRGDLSSIIAGVDYVAGSANPGDVANISLGWSASEAFDNAVIALADAGVKVTLAAGNTAGPSINLSPQRVEHPNVYTISAMDNNDNWASFSSYGNPPVDFCAPGVNISTCFKRHGYMTGSGTSFSAPHCAGILLLGEVFPDGFVNNDPDGNPDPIASWN